MRNRVREQRTQRGLSQADLAVALDVSRQTVISIENGRYLPSLPLAFRIAGPSCTSSAWGSRGSGRMTRPMTRTPGTRRRLRSARARPAGGHHEAVPGAASPVLLAFWPFRPDLRLMIDISVFAVPAI